MNNFDDDSRFTEIESLCSILKINNCDLYLRKMPLENEDPDGNSFSVFTKLVQGIAMWPTTQGIEKCTISQVIMEYNKNFNIPISNIAGYFNDACLNSFGGYQNNGLQQPST